jgi:hypothetical protein
MRVCEKSTSVTKRVFFMKQKFSFTLSLNFLKQKMKNGVVCRLIMLAFVLFSVGIYSSERKLEDSMNNEFEKGINSPLPGNSTLFFQKKQCKNLRKAHRVKPGVSWGTLTRQQQDLWVKLNCDKFFCQPHKLAGKGIYECVPLEKTEN